jgi:tryptophan-rich sensory protein
MRGLRKGPLLAAVALPVLFAVFGAALVGGSGLEWFVGLAKPRFLVPLRVFYLVGALYHVLAAVVLYRILARIDDPRGRAISFGLSVGVLLLNELWNYGFFGLRSTLAGFLGIVMFLALLTTLIAALLRYERVLCGAAGAVLRVGVVRAGLHLQAVEAQLRGGVLSTFGFPLGSQRVNFGELRHRELRRMPLLGTWVNRGMLCFAALAPRSPLASSSTHASSKRTARSRALNVSGM